MRQITDTSEIVPLIREVCMSLLGHANDNEVRLMLGTWAAENGAFHRKQIGGGPARGLWQMEWQTADDIFENYLKYRIPLFEELCKIWIDLIITEYIPLIWTDYGRHLKRYDDFACAMARVHYLRDPDPIPDDLEGQATYWLRVYNAGGKGTVDHYLSQWRACHCDALLGGD